MPESGVETAIGLAVLAIVGSIAVFIALGQMDDIAFVADQTAQNESVIATGTAGIVNLVPLIYIAGVIVVVLAAFVLKSGVLDNFRRGPGP